MVDEIVAQIETDKVCSCLFLTFFKRNVNLLNHIQAALEDYENSQFN